MMAVCRVCRLKEFIRWNFHPGEVTSTCYCCRKRSGGYTGWSPSCLRAWTLNSTCRYIWRNRGNSQRHKGRTMLSGYTPCQSSSIHMLHAVASGLFEHCTSPCTCHYVCPRAVIPWLTPFSFPVPPFLSSICIYHFICVPKYLWPFFLMY